MVQGATHPVLIVDDDAAVRRSLRRLLEREGWEVSESVNGIDALCQLQRMTPELVITDRHMPGGDGLELVRSARRAGRTFPIIMLSGDDGETVQADATALGAIPLVKPFAREDLLLAIAKAMASAPAPRQNSSAA